MIALTPEEKELLERLRTGTGPDRERLYSAGHEDELLMWSLEAKGEVIVTYHNKMQDGGLFHFRLNGYWKGEKDGM